jgi:hypothetical protein
MNLIYSYFSRRLAITAVSLLLLLCQPSKAHSILSIPSKLYFNSTYEVSSMAVSVMARCGPGLGAPFSASARRVRAQPAAGVRAPISFVRIARPRMAPSNAFNRLGSCYNNYDE